MNTKKENVKIFTQEEFEKLESKWYKVEECVPPQDVEVFVTVIYFPIYYNNLSERESYKKIKELGIKHPTQQGACHNTNGSYEYQVYETHLASIFTDKFYWRLNCPSARIIAWMPKPKIEPFKDAKLDLDLELIKDNYLSVSEDLIYKSNIIYK